MTIVYFANRVGLGLKLLEYLVPNQTRSSAVADAWSFVSQDHSTRPRPPLGQWRMQDFRRVGAGYKRHMREDQGAEGVRVWRGGVWVGDCAPSPEKFWTFYLEIALFGAFWRVFKVYIPIFACHFCEDERRPRRLLWRMIQPGNLDNCMAGE